MATIPLADDATLRVPNGVDVTSLKLTQDEGFLVSRLLGRECTVGEIISISGMPPDHTRATLARLVIKGAISVKSFGSSQLDGEPILDEEEEGSSEHDLYHDIVFAPSDLAEPADISDAQRKRILYVESKLEEWSHYSLLGLKRTANPSDIKRAYFKASKEFHPDAYFRKELGSYKGRVDRIFRRMKAAYDVLNDTEKRTAYDETLPADFTPAEQEELRKLADQLREQEVLKARDARQEQRLKDRRLKRNPMTDRILKARSFMKMAEDAQAAGKAADAARHAKLAIEYAPQDVAISQVATRIVEEANAERARALAKRAPSLKHSVDKDEMCAAAEQLAELAPRQADMLAVAGDLLLEGGRPQRALKLAQQATALSRSNAKAWEVLFLAGSKTNSWAIAQKAAEHLKELDPKNGQYKDWLKVAKRNR